MHEDEIFILVSEVNATSPCLVAGVEEEMKTNSIGIEITRARLVYMQQTQCYTNIIDAQQLTLVMTSAIIMGIRRSRRCLI